MDASQHRSNRRVGSLVRGKYHVDTFIATGALANVYAATHRNGTRVALKVLHPEFARDPSVCERFMREGYFANSIGHPGIIRAIDDDVTEDGCPFIVMELLEGETLEARRRRKGGKLPLEWVLQVTDSLLEILTVAHARGVLHRDLKPANVFITKTGHVKVLDFGIARRNDGQSSSDLTAVGEVLGTPEFMAPEQASGRREDVDAQSDIWAVGATLFVVLSGENVHAAADLTPNTIATARTLARPLRDAAPNVPRAVAAVIDRALAFDKRGRWPDADAMRQALRWARLTMEARTTASLGPPSPPVRTPRATTIGHDSSSRPFPAAPPVPARRAIEEQTSANASLNHDDIGNSGPITLRGMTAADATQTPSMGLVPAMSELSGSSRPPAADARRTEPPPAARKPPVQIRQRASSAPAVTPDVPRVTQAMSNVTRPLDTPRPQPKPHVTQSLNVTRAMAAVVPKDGRPSRPGSDSSPLVAASDSFGALATASPSSGTLPLAPLSGALLTASPSSGTLPLASEDPRPSPHDLEVVRPLISAPPPLGSLAPVWSGPSSPPGPYPVPEPSSRPSVPSRVPGPALSQLVGARRGRFARMGVPLALTAVTLAAVFVVMRPGAPKNHVMTSPVETPNAEPTEPASSPRDTTASPLPVGVANEQEPALTFTAGGTPSPSVTSDAKRVSTPPTRRKEAPSVRAASRPVVPRVAREPARPSSEAESPTSDAPAAQDPSQGVAPIRTAEPPQSNAPSPPSAPPAPSASASATPAAPPAASPLSSPVPSPLPPATEGP